MEFVDVNLSPMSPRGFSLSALTARKRLYVQTNSGELLSGVEALLSIWYALPDFGWLARIGRLPVLHGAVAVLYDLFFAPGQFLEQARAQKSAAKHCTNHLGGLCAVKKQD